MKRLICLAIGLAVLVIGGALMMAPSVMGAPNYDPHKNVIVSSDEAKAKLQRLLPPDRRDVKYQGTKDRPGIRVHVFSGDGVTAMVDVSDGHVASLSLPVPPPSGVTAVTSEDQAKRIAIDYLSAVGSPVDGLSIEVRNSTGAGTPGYTVIFTRTKGDIVLPDYRMVEVDAGTGQVFSFVDVRRPFQDPGTPKLSARDAASAAVSQLGGGSAKTPQLIVSWDKAGHQKLVWLVPVSGSAGDPGIVVPIDASSGDKVDLTQ